MGASKTCSARRALHKRVRWHWLIMIKKEKRKGLFDFYYALELEVELSKEELV